MHDEVRYRVVHDGLDEDVTIDPTAGGWIPLGEFEFAAGGDQLVAVHDDHGSDPGDDQHVVADAIRLTRLDLPVDTAPPEDTDLPMDDSRPWSDGQPLPWSRERISGCAASPALFLLVGLWLSRRRA
ncbi:MAG: hypothetical protein GY913_26380 [Proteobacteria bacterium]|nr:hypothetical protein [Pseudomonadota bacterium]MCP4920444.1 hypothetical protein [Pseudomonadota bacterium]